MYQKVVYSSLRQRVELISTLSLGPPGVAGNLKTVTNISSATICPWIFVAFIVDNHPLMQVATTRSSTVQVYFV